MGMFDFFSRRRRRESAVQAPGADPAALGSFAASEGQPVVGGQIAGGDFGGGDLDELAELQGGVQALAALSQLGPMLQQAMTTGTMQVQVGEPQAIDARGTDLGDEIREIMKRHGIDAESGTSQGNVDPEAVGTMQQEIFAALARHGVSTQAPSGSSFSFGSVQVSRGGKTDRGGHGSDGFGFGDGGGD